MEKMEFLSLFRIGISIHNFNKISEREVGLSLVQWCLLRKLIDMPAASAFSLAKEVGIHPSTLTQTLKRLEKKGFVFISEDPKDSRRKVVSLTRLGRKSMQDAEKKMSVWRMNFSEVKNELLRVQKCLAVQLEDQIKD